MPDRRAAGGRSGAPSDPGDPTVSRPDVPPTSRPDYQGLLRQVPAILYTADPGELGRWEYVSPQIEQVLGFTPEEWCADPASWSRQLHPDDAQRVVTEEAERVRTGDADGVTEYRILHRDGHALWVRDDAVLRRGVDGVVRWHGVILDITERKRAEAELKLRIAQQAAVARLGEHALEGASPTDLMREAVDACVELLAMDIAAVAAYLPDEDALRLRVTHGLRAPMRHELVPAAHTCQSGYVLLTGRPAVVDDWDGEDRFARSRVLAEHGARCGLAVAIEGRGAPWGVLGCHSLKRREITQGDVDFVQSLANVLGDVVERELTNDDIRHRALHDSLTGLPNRTLFVDRLQQATERRRRAGTLTAILTLDLDRFKLVNESLGHPIGDELLAAIAPRLRQAVRSSDTVARFGGDEFAILLDEIGGEHDATEMAERIAAVFTRPFVLAGSEHFVTTSIGIALAAGGEPADDLLRDADVAMHRAKERGRARYELFDEHLRGRAISQLRVENDLRRALARDELTLHYQPLVSLPGRSLVAVEALIRWEHPERGQIPPADFIPVAEENGLIEPIGRWVLDRACRQAARWYRERPDAPPVAMSVNLSAVQVAGAGVVETVAAALRASGLDPALLALELTESVMVGDADELRTTLSALKALGVRLVLDDFGTGYSSLSYLQRLPLDALKVDRSFVAGLGTEPRGTAITEAIVAMSHALSLQVVGEGAETELQVAELTRLGCDMVQGYRFCGPVPASEITAMLSRGPSWPAGGPTGVARAQR